MSEIGGNVKRIILVLILMAVFGIVGHNLSAAPEPGQGLNPVGLWLGTISFGGMDLRVAIKIVKAQDGSLKATMDSLDQGAKDIPVDSVTVEGNRLLIEMKAIKMLRLGGNSITPLISHPPGLIWNGFWLVTTRRSLK